MTSAIEYSYLSNGFTLNISEDLMTRAVRVKGVVKDKLKRIFEGNVNVVEANDVKETAASSDVTSVTDETLIDLSEDNLNSLNDKLNALQLQENVPYVVSRAVLFTQPLVKKIEGVTGRWFKGMPVLERTEQKVSEEVADSVGVVPGTWDDVPENSIETSNTEITTPVETSVPEEVAVPEPVLEAVPSVEETPSIEVNDSEVEQELPTFEPTVQAEDVASDIPSFMPNMDELVPSEDVPVSEPQSIDLVPGSNVSSEVEETDFVPEPVSLVAGEPEIEVSEPRVITDSEPEVESPAVEEQVTEEVSKEVPVASENTTEEKTMTVEEKIAALIERKKAVHSEEEPAVTVVSEAAPSEEEDVKVREGLKPELTQAGVIARLQRLNNTMKDKDATIRTLTAKNESAKEEVAQAREKINGYEAVVSDLTVRNNNLTKENERLSAKVEEAETASQSTIAKLEAQVAELTEAKNQESEASKKIVSELKEKHASEIAALKEKHAAELKSVSETKDRQIQAIYATISEALGEPVADEDYGYSKAA